jgi:hypothetical protein
MRPIPAIALAIAMLFAGAAGAAEFSTLEERMSEQEFRAAGLDRLSAEELASLNAWLARRNVTTARAPSGGSEGFRSSALLGDSGSRSAFSSIATSNQQQIGSGSIVTLENGQAWEITSGSLSVSGSLAGKRISVEPAALGSWRLKVEGYNLGLRAIRVR